MAITVHIASDTGSNKPGKHSVQFEEQAYSYQRPSNHIVSVLKPKIDRFSVTYPVNDPATRNLVRSRLQDLSETEPETVKKVKPTKHWGSVRYARSYKVILTNGQGVLIQCAAENSSLAFLRIEFNPNALGPEGVKSFRAMLPHLTHNAVGWNSLGTTGRVTRVDVAVDLVNIGLDDILIRTVQLGKTMNYFGKDGQSETKYMNVSKKGSKSYVYDRKVRLVEAKKASEFGEAKYIRTEVRIVPECALSDLAKLQNKLTKIEFFDFEAPTPPENIYHWKHFQDSCRYRGFEGALQAFPPELRKAYEKAVADVAGGLWQPENLWTSWPSVVSNSGLWP